jgi:phosphoglycerate dehydrogenase-like enzyme
MQFLEGKTLLVSGMGGIGTEVARRGAGLGMNVIATREGGSGRPDFVSYIGQPGELLTLARTADVVVSALPLTPQTRVCMTQVLRYAEAHGFSSTSRVAAS